jgi:hypothetical protein
LKKYKVRILYCGQEIDHWITVAEDDYYANEQGYDRVYDEIQVTTEEVKEE